MTFGGIIYVHDISADRDTGENARRSLAMLSGSCPEATSDKVVLVTTKWNVLGEAPSAAREAELKAGQWARLLRDAHLMRLYPDSLKEGPASAWEVVRHVLWRLDMRIGREAGEEVARLKGELVKSGKDVPEEAEVLQNALREAVELQSEVFELMKGADREDKEVDVLVKSREERLRTLHQLVILNKSLFYGSLVPNLTHKWIAFNSVVVG